MADDKHFSTGVIRSRKGSERVNPLKTDELPGHFAELTSHVSPTRISDVIHRHGLRLLSHQCQNPVTVTFMSYPHNALRPTGTIVIFGCDGRTENAWHTSSALRLFSQRNLKPSLRSATDTAPPLEVNVDASGVKIDNCGCNMRCRSPEALDNYMLALK